MIRVLVCEDSGVARQLLVSIVESDAGLSVVGQAKNGAEAVAMAAELRPDVITMDVHMPVLDGLAATRQIMEATPRPIVVVSANDPNDVAQSFDALQAGALSVLGKPRGPTSPDFARLSSELTNALKAMAEMKVVRRRPRRDVEPASAPETTRPPAPAGPPVQAAALPPGRVDVVAIGSSTGGPAALARILSALPGDLGVPVVIVQHISQGFDQGLVTWLDGLSPLTVRLACDGDPLRAGEVLVAPCDAHMAVSGSDRKVSLDRSPAVDGHRPSASVLFRSVARAYGRHALALILTGMGEDGASGLVELHAGGATVLAQDEASCIVYGMPAAAVARGAVSKVLALDEMASAIGEALTVAGAARAA